MDDDEDSFLYGDSAPQLATTYSKTPTEEPESTRAEPDHPQETRDGFMDVLETRPKLNKSKSPSAPLEEEEAHDEPAPSANEEEDEGGEEEEESDDEDVEFIMEPAARSLDFRSGRPPPPPAQPQQRQPPHAPTSGHQPAPPINLTTEYTPRERGGPVEALKQESHNSQQRDTQSRSPPPTFQNQIHNQDQSHQPDDGVDPSSLPPATAPSSHPPINPLIPGTIDGRPIFEIDMTNLAEKPWRRPGSDLSDWFNYGFDELSWEAYCYRRREMGDVANVMKTNVVNFAGMPEEQLMALPPEVRTMVMTGANAIMSVGGNPGIIAGGMNPMMHDMSGMGPMAMGPMGMGMNGDMVMPGGGMMSEVPSMPVPNVGPGGGTPEQVQMALHQDGFGPGGPGPGMMGVNMGGEFGMQEPSMNQYQGMEGSGGPVAPVRGVAPAPAPFRGRGLAQGPRGRGGFVARGRGRGMYTGEGMPPPAPVRPASPLPPNVPTGPRNPGNRYKDRDNNAPAVDGLDYGGNKEGSMPLEDDKGSRKRRASPGIDDERTSRSKRR